MYLDIAIFIIHNDSKICIHILESLGMINIAIDAIVICVYICIYIHAYGYQYT